MRKRIVSSILAASLLVVLSAALAYSGSSARVNVAIPFAFTVGNMSLPSGDYTISETAANGVLLIQNRHQDLAIYVSSFTGRSSGQYGDARIVFNRYSEKYFLSKVFYGTGDSRKLPVSRLERDFIGATHSAAHNSKPVEVVAVGTR
ncbi:MAG TPA: hypothetical protein VE398_16250 [Acidobacteriota bacterium]|nr:hypothetical protein [Acidobacteriota bacterium]